MSYCGVPLNDNNIPYNWKEQMIEIIKSLKKCNILNNDMYRNNFLVHNNTIYLIDFGWASSNEDDFPFSNVIDKDIDNYDNIFELFDHVYQRYVEKRIKMFKGYK